MAPVTITYMKEGTKPPIYLAGSFSGWEAQEMEYEIPQGQEEIRFYKKVEGQEGEKYQYKFRIGPGDWWALDESAPVGKYDRRVNRLKKSKRSSSDISAHFFVYLNNSCSPNNTRFSKLTFSPFAVTDDSGNRNNLLEIPTKSASKMSDHVDEKSPEEFLSTPHTIEAPEKTMAVEDPKQNELATQAEAGTTEVSEKMNEEEQGSEEQNEKSVDLSHTKRSQLTNSVLLPPQPQSKLYLL